MKSYVCVLGLILAGVNFAVGQDAVVIARDLKLFEGSKWTGTLTYRDYTSNKTTSIKSTLAVARKKKTALKTWTFNYEYPDEPKANSESVVVLSNDGRKFSGEDVIERSYLPDRTLRIVTTQAGKDDDRQALFRFTYLITRTSLSIRKEVRIAGSEEWFERNRYSFAIANRSFREPDSALSSEKRWVAAWAAPTRQRWVRIPDG